MKVGGQLLLKGSVFFLLLFLTVFLTLNPFNRFSGRESSNLTV